VLSWCGRPALKVASGMVVVVAGHIIRQLGGIFVFNSSSVFLRLSRAKRAQGGQINKKSKFKLKKIVYFFNIN
jgi:hypothetical protein